jgi:Phosphotransferase enzyme family
MGRLRHGFTNRTRRLAGGRVQKEYTGSNRFERAAYERACLVRLRGTLPVPLILASDEQNPLLIMVEAAGLHGQDLVDAGRAPELLGLLGVFLHELQQLSPATVPELAGTGGVIAHGDFGPQNVLVDGHRITAVVDWEFAHLGQPVEDLAWAEWIVRMHHPSALDALAALHRGAQLSPNWSARHDAMLARCRQLIVFCEQNQEPAGVQLWRERLRATEEWVE